MLECAMMINTYLIELSEVFIWVSTAEKVAQISLVKEHVLLEVVIGVADRLRLLLLARVRADLGAAAEPERRRPLLDLDRQQPAGIWPEDLLVQLGSAGLRSHARIR